LRLSIHPSVIDFPFYVLKQIQLAQNNGYWVKKDPRKYIAPRVRIDTISMTPLATWCDMFRESTLDSTNTANDIVQSYVQFRTVDVKGTRAPIDRDQSDSRGDLNLKIKLNSRCVFDRVFRKEHEDRLFRQADCTSQVTRRFLKA
jgi:hypothetical protein